jgi:CheY-like chemotaxis protein/DnaJ-domain-containing protein 1
MALTILCADADRDLCRILTRALGVEGYAVVAVHDGEAALGALDRAAPALALVDADLPRRNGLAVLEAIRGCGGPGGRIPVLLLTSGPRPQGELERLGGLGDAELLEKPVSLDDLSARIAKLLGRGAEASATGAGRYRVSPGAPVRGSLSDLPFPALLHQVYGLRASGVLRLSSGRKQKRLELRDGRPAAVASNLTSERLGEFLVRSGRIEPGHRNESIQRMKRGEGLQGQVLVAMDALSVEELASELHEQALEKLLEIFEWESGQFELVRGRRLRSASTLALSDSPANLILSGVRTRFPQKRIDSLLAAYGDAIAVAGENPYYSFQETSLTRAEERMLGLCGTGLAIAAVRERAPEERRAVYALLEVGLVELRESGDRRAKAARVRLHARPAARGASPAPAAPQAEADHSHYAADHDARAELTGLVEQLRAASPFAKLGVGLDASPAEIRSAYTTLAKKTHPDRYAQASDAVLHLAEDAFRHVTLAYEVLSDPERLAVYREDPERDAKQAEDLEEANRALAAEQEFQRGEARLAARDWEGALSCFERAVGFYPEEGEYLAYCGWAYYLTHGHDEDVLRRSVGMVKKAAKLSPDREKPYLFLGRLYQAIGRLDLAELMFTQTLKRKSDCIEALRELRLLEMRKPKQGLVGRLLRRSKAAKRSPGAREA